MGVSLGYKSRGLISPKHVAQILEDAKKLKDSRKWWAEPIFFFPPDADDEPNKGLGGMVSRVIDSLLGLSGTFMEGDTKFSLAGGYSGPNHQFVHVDADEDEIMGYFDVGAILGFLARWARVTGVGWQIACVGEECGIINDDGTMDAHLKDFLDSFIRHSTYSPSDPGLPDLLRKIDQKYASRG